MCHSLLSLLVSCSFCNLNRLRQTLFEVHNLFFYSLERNCINVFNKIDSILLVLKNRLKLTLSKVILSEINALEIKELPREIKLEKPIELDKSELHPKWEKLLIVISDKKKFFVFG